MSNLGEINLDSTLRSSPCRILIVDDHPTFRRGLAALVFETSELEICGQAENLPGALHLMRRSAPDLAIVDISLPGANGIELIKAMLSECPKLRILVLSMHNESQFAIRALRAGARGYLTKCEPADEIIIALRKIRSGGLYVGPMLADRLIFKAIHSLDEGCNSEVERLSDRELEVFNYLGKGYGTKEIADLLKLSGKTGSSEKCVGRKGRNRRATPP